jgi:trk system potassium uptake protein TrkH
MMLAPLAFGLLSAGDDPRPSGYALVITLAAGGILRRMFRRPETDLSQREGILLVCAAWASVSLFGCLPYWFSPYFKGFVDAFFESVSGFTTTGATVLEKVEVLPASLQFWRCFSHWLGGMGIVLLGVAVLPLLGIGGMHLYRAEFSGAKSEKLKPRITETALSLWKIYAALTIAQYIALRWAGMDPFESICHTFSTLGTGGFSTRTPSVAGFQSPAIEYIIIVFMLMAGINFTRHYRLWVERKPSRFFGDIEVQGYLLLVAAATVAIGASLALQSGFGAERAFRAALFQVSSISTTTGFATEDFELWRPLPQLILLALMFAGGCTGSTSGGLKVSRLLLLKEVVGREFRRIVERRGVFAIRLGRDVVPESAVQSVLNLVYLAFLVNFVSCLLLAAVGVDVLTSISAVSAAMFNVGPGLGTVGPSEHYGHLPALAKWVLTACMLGGRLEFYTALVIWTPAFWRK